MRCTRSFSAACGSCSRSVAMPRFSPYRLAMVTSLYVPLSVGVVETISPRALNLPSVLPMWAFLRPLYDLSRGFFCPGRCILLSLPSSMTVPRPGPGRHFFTSRMSVCLLMCSSYLRGVGSVRDSTSLAIAM